MDEIGFDLASTQILENSSPPTHFVVLGGRHIGCKLASIYWTLGSRVTLVEEKPTVLWNWDPLVPRSINTAPPAAFVGLRFQSEVLTGDLLPVFCGPIGTEQHALPCERRSAGQVMSTRRFFARPSSVSFDATGLVSPNPRREK
jgi:hypothetical protein